MYEVIKQISNVTLKISVLGLNAIDSKKGTENKITLKKGLLAEPSPVYSDNRGEIIMQQKREGDKKNIAKIVTDNVG